jgi:hypothetical protein
MGLAVEVAVLSAVGIKQVLRSSGFIYNVSERSVIYTFGAMRRCNF